MDEKNINLQALEKGDQNKVERNGDEKISSEGGLEHDGPSPVQVSLKDAEQSHFTETNFDRESHMNSKTPDMVPVVEATQELEPEEKGGFASTPRVTPVPFDLNVVDGEGMEEQIPPSSDLQESPREVNQSRSGSLKFDLNHSSQSPPASPSPSSSSSSSVPQPFIENFDRNDTEEPHIHNDSLLHGAEPDASVFRIMGTNVEVKKNKGVPETMPPPNNGKALYLFGYNIRGMAVRATSSPLSAVQPPPLSLSCLTCTGGTNSKEPGGGLEPSMAAKKAASSSSSTVVGKGKEPEGDIRGMVVRAICSPSAVVQPPPLPLSCLTSTGGTETKEPESDVRGMAVMTTCSPSAAVEPPPLSLSRLTSTGGRGTKRKEPEGSQEPYVAKKNRACSC